MGAGLDHLALVEHDDLVRVDDRRQPVRDHERRAAAHQLAERALHGDLALRVERRGRLVEEQDRRVAQDRARDGDALLLTARQAGAPLSRHGVVAVGEARDELVDPRRGRGRLDLFLARAGAAAGDVLTQRRVEQERVLADHGRAAAVVGEAELAEVAPVDQDRAAVRVVEPHQQIERRRLAAARLADERDGLAGARVHAETAQDGVAVVGELHVAQLDVAAQALEAVAAAHRRVGVGLQDVLDPGERARRLAQHVVGPRHPLDVLIGGRQRRDDDRDVVERDRALHHHEVAEQHEHGRGRRLVADERGRDRARLGAEHAARPLQEAGRGLFEVAHVRVLELVGLDRPDPREDLVEGLGRLPHRLQALAAPLLDLLALAVHGHRHQRHHRDQDHDRLRHEPEDRDGVAEDHQRVDDDVVRRHLERPLDDLRVVRHAADHVAHATLAEEAQRQAQKVPGELAAEVGHHAVGEEARDRLDQVDGHGSQDPAAERDHAAGDHDVHARAVERHAEQPAQPRCEVLEPRVERVLELAVEAGRCGRALPELPAHLRHQRLDDQEGQLGEDGLQDRQRHHGGDHAPVAHDRGPDPAQQRLDVTTILGRPRHGV